MSDRKFGIKNQVSPVVTPENSACPDLSDLFVPVLTFFFFVPVLTFFLTFLPQSELERAAPECRPGYKPGLARVPVYQLEPGANRIASQPKNW